MVVACQTIFQTAISIIRCKTGSYAVDSIRLLLSNLLLLFAPPIIPALISPAVRPAPVQPAPVQPATTTRAITSLTPARANPARPTLASAIRFADKVLYIKTRIDATT
ncbi:hypothetical protein BDV93DRAFT_529048 [Ceratobasidium sp. AG-I]|nr:hypothetical protein BDV93DRAFT_529048 [Ceratobasidium sp. AG-I]